MGTSPPASELRDDLQEAVWSLSRSTIGTLRESLRGVGLSPPQYWILQMVETEGPLATSEVAQRLCVRAPTATGLVDHLVHDGFVRRTASRDDRRVVRIGATAKGIGTLRSIRAELRLVWRSRLDRMPLQRRRRALESLRELSRYLGEPTPNAPAGRGRRPTRGRPHAGVTT